MSDTKPKIMPFRCDDELREKIDTAAEMTGLSKADIMRLAMQIGLIDLKRINYELAQVVSDKADEKKRVSYYDHKRPSLSMVAEEHDEGNGKTA